MFCIISFFGGMFASRLVNAVSSEDPDLPYRKLAIFTRVLNYIQNNYVEEVSEDKLIYGSIRGMTDTLDPHTMFMPPEIFNEMKIDTKGEFGGLGIEITVKDDKLIIVSPFEDTPAFRAGILAGDEIVAIDGKEIKGLSLMDAVRMMRGSIGSKIHLSIMREGFQQPKIITIMRDRIKIASVDGKLLESRIGYVRIKSFQEKTDFYLKKQLKNLQKQAGGQISSLILDLRGNPGGLLDQAVKVSDLFLDEGVIVSTEGRNKKPLETLYATKEGTEPHYPILVLVDHGSASASEIVAGAIQDHGRGVIGGVRSFGKGTVQTIIELDDGSGLKLTIAKYFTPKKRSIQDHGIEPDLVFEASDKTEPEKASIANKDKDVEKNKNNRKEDRPLQMAISYLTNKIHTQSQ